MHLSKYKNVERERRRNLVWRLIMEVLDLVQMQSNEGERERERVDKAAVVSKSRVKVKEPGPGYT